MKLLRNSYFEILILFYFSLTAFLPGFAVLKLVHALTNYSHTVRIALLFLSGLIATFLSLMGVLLFCVFFSAVLLGKYRNVESFYR